MNIKEICWNVILTVLCIACFPVNPFVLSGLIDTGFYLSLFVLGWIVWAIGMTSLGYYLGSALGHVEGIDKYFTLLVLAFFFIPGLPTLLHVWRDNKDKIFDWVNARLRRQLPSEDTVKPDA